MPWFAKIILIGVVIWLIATIISDHIKENRPSRQSEARKSDKAKDAYSKSTVKSSTPYEAVINEAIPIINDFLNIGDLARLLTDSSTDFRGLIICAADARPPFHGRMIDYGLHIKLNDVGDLTIGAQKYSDMLARFPEEANKYNSFIRKHRYNYDASERGYVYRTTNTVSLREGEEKMLYSELSQQVIQRCPLAEYGSNGLLYTKNVNHP